MTVIPVKNFPNPSIDVFAKTAVKVLKAGTTTGATLVASYGLINAPSASPIVDQTISNLQTHFEGLIKLSNGREILLTPSIESPRQNYHHSSASRIDYNEANEIAEIMLWTDPSREAIVLKDKSAIESFNNEYKLVKESSYEFEPKSTFKFSGEFNIDKTKELDLFYDEENVIRGYSLFDFEPETTFKFK